MDRFKIEGGRKLEGTVRISGAKNAALPAMAAALLTSERVTCKIFRACATSSPWRSCWRTCAAAWKAPDLPPSEFTIQAETVSDAEAPYELVRTMRASILTLGPLVARTGLRARLAARRLRHRRAARGPAPQGARKDGRGDLHRARLRGGATPKTPARRALSLRENHRDRHGKYSDGGGAGGRRNAFWRMRARAGSDRPGGAADQDGRADRRRRHVHAARFRASSDCTARPTR